MFSSRRLAKRSIIGTRVCTNWQDGRFYPGIIIATDTGPSGDELYTVRFDDGFIKTVTDGQLIGPCFQNITITKLKNGQRVFITYNGREVSGLVVQHDLDTDEVLINAKLPNGQELNVARRLHEVRLMESRKSARLQDQDMDYSKLADLHPEPKKRAVSHVIDVPSPAAKHSRRRKSSPDPEESGLPELKECDDVDMMDENMAAMVLTSLSCSPASPQFPTSFTDKDSISPGAASSFGSSGVFTLKSEAGTPSPPQLMSTSAPPAPVFSQVQDEGIEMDYMDDYFMEDSGPKRRRQSTRTVFKCTWPGCEKILNTNLGIEKHVRDEHLGPRTSDDDSDLSDHEEEFYYTEIEVSVDTVTETFADMYTSSPSEGKSHMEASRSIVDHDYQKKEPRSSPQVIPGHRTHPKIPSPMSNVPPVAFPSTSQFSKSWTIGTSGSSPISPPIRITKSGQGKAHSLSSSPMHRKSRSDTKKCRKVYGMENRDLWCTQCKWKKACSRFLD